MPIPDQATVESALDPYHSTIREIVLSAWGDWLRNPDASLYQFNRTRACIVWEHMVRRAQEAFLDDPSVQCVEKHNTCHFFIDNSILLRFKKADERGLSCNYPTSLALDFHDPEAALPGFPEVSRVEVIYIVNELGTGVDSVQVVARNGSRVAWSYDIPGQPVAPVEPIPTTHKPATKPSQMVTVRKPDKTLKDQANES